MGPDTALAMMVALIFLSGLSFVAYMGLDAIRARARAGRSGGEPPRRAAAVVGKVTLVVGALFLVSAFSVLVWLIGG